MSSRYVRGMYIFRSARPFVSVRALFHFPTLASSLPPPPLLGWYGSFFWGPGLLSCRLSPLSTLSFPKVQPLVLSFACRKLMHPMRQD